jgi:hypothetical protein
MRTIDIVKELCPIYFKDFRAIIHENNKVAVYIWLGPYRRHVTNFDVDMNGKVTATHIARQRIKDVCLQWSKLFKTVPYPNLIRWIIEQISEEISQDPSMLRDDLNYVVQKALKKYESKLLRELPSKNHEKLVSVFKNLTRAPYYFTIDERDRIHEIIHYWVDIYNIYDVTVEHIYRAAKIYAEMLKTLFLTLGGRIPTFLSECDEALSPVHISDEDWNALLPGYVTRKGLAVADIFVLLALMWRGSRVIGTIYLL